MKVKHNISLAQYTTIKLGGIAENLFFPETESEIIELKKKYGSQLYLIGGGSNLLINDKNSYPSVAVLRKLNSYIEVIGGGCFKVGAGIRLQELINTINECGYGGIEYLYSVPGLVGGAVVMNAGRSKKHGNCISDYIVSVRVMKNEEIIELPKDECGFCFRGSIFKNNDAYIVLSATFKFPLQNIEQSKNLKKQRLELCKAVQDNSKPNFGSVFINASSKIMKIACKLSIGNKKAHFSSKTANWILKEENGEYQDVIHAMNIVIRMHKLLGKKIEPEVIIWQ